MNQVIPRLWIASNIALGCLVTVSSVRAQIVPDHTLPVNSRVTPGCTVCTINGGTVRGANLFHSFSEFSVPTGGEAYFNNGLQIQNILTRVTGNSVSNIDGVLRANGTANLFLLNPNGIIFGAGASLNVGGSFVATTANAIGFGNLGFFSATTPNAPSPLLTVNPSALLFNQFASAPITSQSIAPAGLDPIGEATYGLRVPDGRSLLLVGGDISVDGLGIGDPVNGVNGGGLKAYGGRIELGGLAGAGTVGLVVDGNNLSLSFPIGVARANVSLTNVADVKVLAGGGGSIAVNAQNFSMAGVSQLLAGIDLGLGSSGSIAGNIEINTTGVINLSNLSSLDNLVAPGARGQGGDTNITTKQLLVSGGSQIGAGTFGAGNAGNLTVSAADKVQVIGKSADGQYSSGLFTESQGTGNAGNLTITTGQLLISNGAQVSAATFGAGNGGNLTIHAADKVQVIGEAADGQTVSSLVTQSEGTGNAGNLTITTGQLLVSDGAQVSAATFGAGNGGNLTVHAADKVQLIGESADGQIHSGLVTQSQGTGNAGNLTITTGQLLVSDGAQVSAGTFGAGNGGNLTVHAADKVQLIGESADNRFSSGLFTESQGTGNAGNLMITTPTLQVQDGARVSVRNLTAQAGNLTITANSLFLNRGILSAETGKSSPQGGANITLKGLDLLQLDNESLISASALNAANGGNINIDTKFLIARSPQGPNGSDIIANAFQGRGGQIQIQAAGIFGMEQRRAIPGNRTNDIDASSEFGAAGVVTLNTLINPSQGLTELPTQLIDPSRQIATECTSRGDKENKFTVTGRGGLPSNPNEVLSPDLVQDDFGTPATGQEDAGTRGQGDTKNSPTTLSASYSQSPIPNPPKQLVEAQGWIIGPDGKVILTPDAPNATPQGTWETPVNCQVSQTTSQQ